MVKLLHNSDFSAHETQRIIFIVQFRQGLEMFAELHQTLPPHSTLVEFFNSIETLLVIGFAKMNNRERALTDFLE